MIAPADVTPATVAAMVLDPERRRELLASMAREQGSGLSLTNAYEQAARTALATPDELRRAVQALVAEGQPGQAGAFVFHPAMPDDVLLDLCDRGLCVSELAHRPLPRPLLRRVVDLHRYPEAILSLALDLYRDPDASVAEFAAHVRAHAGHEWMLRALAEVDASDRAKEEVYESLLAGFTDAASFHARHLARSAHVPEARLADFLAAHPDPAVLVLLLRSEIADPGKRALVERTARARASDPELASELSRLRACAAAAAADLTPEAAEALFAAGDPEVLLELAGNRKTPRRILEQLAERKGARLAQPTRTRARQSLRGKLGAPGGAGGCTALTRASCLSPARPLASRTRSTATPGPRCCS